MSNSSTTIKRSRGLFYGWIIVTAGFLVSIITYGGGFSFGVFLTPFRESFGWTSAAVSVAYSLSMFFYAGLAIFAGWGVDKYGPKKITMLGGLLLGLGLLLTSRVNTLWQLYVAYGLIGTGMCPAYTPLMTTVSRWFVKRRGLALGVFSTGIGVGPLIAAPLASYLISTSGWRFAYLVLGSAAGLIIAAALLLKRSPEEIGELPYGETYNANIPPPKTKESKVTSEFSEFSLKEALNTKAFWLLASIFLMVGMGMQMVLAHVVAYSMGRGMSPITAATMLSIISGASIAGRVIMGLVSDRIGRKKAFAICVFTEGVMIFWLIGASNAWMLFTFGAIWGFSYGGHSPQFPALIGETFGLRYMGAILGAATFFWGVGSALGPVVAGHILDITGSYSNAFIIGGVVTSLAAAVSFLLKRPEREKGTQIADARGT